MADDDITTVATTEEEEAPLEDTPAAEASPEASLDEAVDPVVEAAAEEAASEEPPVEEPAAEGAAQEEEAAEEPAEAAGEAAVEEPEAVAERDQFQVYRELAGLAEPTPANHAAAARVQASVRGRKALKAAPAIAQHQPPSPATALALPAAVAVPPAKALASSPALSPVLSQVLSPSRSANALVALRADVEQVGHPRPRTTPPPRSSAYALPDTAPHDPPV